MQSTDLEEIKAAIFEQAYHPCTRVSWGMAQVIEARKNRGQQLVQLRGLSRWYPVETVTIERPRLCPTGRATSTRKEQDEQHGRERALARLDCRETWMLVSFILIQFLRIHDMEHQ